MQSNVPAGVWICCLPADWKFVVMAMPIWLTVASQVSPSR